MGKPPAFRPGVQSRPEADAWGVAPGRRRDLRAYASRGQRCGGESAAPESRSLLDAASESQWLWLEPRALARESHRRQGLGFCEDLVEEAMRPRRRRRLHRGVDRGHERSSQAPQPPSAPPGDQGDEDPALLRSGLQCPLRAVVWAALCERRFLSLCLSLGQVTPSASPEGFANSRPHPAKESPLVSNIWVLTPLRGQKVKGSRAPTPGSPIPFAETHKSRERCWGLGGRDAQKSHPARAPAR